MLCTTVCSAQCAVRSVRGTGRAACDKLKTCEAVFACLYAAESCITRRGIMRTTMVFTSCAMMVVACVRDCVRVKHDTCSDYVLSFNLI